MSVDYSAAGNVASPVQHFWTHSVEEQFYFALPLVLLLAAAMLRISRRPRRTIVIAVLFAITTLSLAHSVWLTLWSESTAYLSTETRAWDFGVGALAATLPALHSVPVRTVLSGVGLTFNLAAVSLFSADTPFPGYAAMLPVIGTALVVWLGAGTFVGTLGRVELVSLLGRIS